MAAKLQAILAFLSVSSFVASAVPTRTSPKISARDAFEWTALGDSYASGIGAGVPLEAKRCFRYSEAYPQAIQEGDNILPDHGSRVLNNVVCSGASTGDILAHQFADEDEEDNMYGKRPKFGNPKMATLSLGGNDIGLRYLLNSCVYNFYPTYYSCDDAIKDAFAAIDNPSLVDGISSVISKTLEKGRAGPAGNDFKVFVAGYAQFFNSKTPQCSLVTWARLVNLTAMLNLCFAHLLIFSTIGHGIERDANWTIKSGKTSTIWRFD
jgi:lysophospholipase L1-like esterase